jgi:hypothetical protein
MYTLIGTAKLCDVDPQAYLQHVLERGPGGYCTSFLARGIFRRVCAGLPETGHSPTTARGRACVKTLEPPMPQCIFGHVGSISRAFVDLNRALPNPHGM